MSDTVIKADHVSKKFCRYLKNSMVYGLSDIGRNAVGLSSHSGRLRKNEFWSVDDVSFEVKSGEAVGLVGANGSGKTTTLKMLNGIFWPDKGKITVRGRVGALIAVGAGFHPLLTGRENIYINGAILGMSKKEVGRKFDSIVDFADIGNFIDSPIKHYSSGMYVRLGFAVAVHANCDILLIDEILAVGDVNFQKKCIEKIKEKASQGAAIIFVSHHLDAVQMLCKNSIYLSKGKIIEYGKTNDILDKLRKDIVENRTVNVNAVRLGIQDVVIKKVELLDRSNNVKTNFKRGEACRIEITYYARKPVKDPRFTIGVAIGDTSHVIELDTCDYGFETGEIYKDGKVIYSLEALPLQAGKYMISVGCWDPANHIPYDYQDKMYPLIVEEGLNISPEWEIIKGNFNDN